MNYIEKFPKDQIPDFKDLQEYIHSDCFVLMNEKLSDKFSLKLKLNYSSCSWQPGWNIKYMCKGKNLLTCYPLEGSFLVLIVLNVHSIGLSEYIENCCEIVQKAYYEQETVRGQKWLMMEVNHREIVNDLVDLVSFRLK